MAPVPTLSLSNRTRAAATPIATSFLVGFAFTAIFVPPLFTTLIGFTFPRLPILAPHDSKSTQTTIGEWSVVVTHTIVWIAVLTASPVFGLPQAWRSFLTEQRYTILVLGALDAVAVVLGCRRLMEEADPEAMGIALTWCSYWTSQALWWSKEDVALSE
ncbi:hypothetical protein MNV49_005256 [Pseudohyphozyma bogoriensis]|nr:hypothetical protein MNV49_005256 [Pseudohyphozyma bogoriensis]